jgi:hypothetical protein
MIPDSNVLLRKWLLQSTDLAAVLPPRDGLGVKCTSGDPNNSGSIYIGVMPKGFDPVDGPGMQIGTRGGSPHPEIIDLAQPSIQVRFWDAPGKDVRCRTAYRTFFDFVHGKVGEVAGFGIIKSCVVEVDGQDGIDPETKWVSVLTFVQLIAHA